jgi:sterol desaturase/sphingolipid hydroxylase (fatty acid hydroxylase superfamily)
MNAPTLTGLAVAFAVLFVVFRALELRLPRHRRTPLLRPGLTTDVSYWLIAPFVTHYIVRTATLIVVCGFALLVYGRIDQSDILAGFGPVSRLPMAVQAALMLLIGDFFGYWVHRFLHGGRLWPFHAVHHSSTTLDWLSSVRAHPVNEVLNRTATTLPLLAMGFAPAAAVWIAPVFAIFAIMLHANLDWDFGPLRTVIASPRFHRWHHTSEAEGRDKNFAGLFPVFDIIFGTYYMPMGRLPERFGTNTPVPDGLLAQLVYPFRRQRPGQ